MDFIDNNRCFLCGKNNPYGFQLNFDREGDITLASTQVPWHYQGFKGVVHGGIVASLLDEIMSQSIKNSGKFAVTGNLEVKYHRPCLTEKELLVKGWIAEVSGRLIKAKGEVIQDEELKAEGEGLFIVPSKSRVIKTEDSGN
ncbi:MAG: hypothetical protein PWP04_538 [Candidatus Atribacteria bacterium]|nr:hypothetical protein [Candidatus Atribacteria bacterium]